MHILPLLKFLRYVLEKDIQAQDQLDGWEDGWEDVEEVGHHQGLSYIPEIIRIELTSHCGIEKTWELVARRLCRPTVAIDTHPLLEKHQLWLDPCHYRPVDLMGGLINRFCDRIVYIYRFKKHQLLFNPVDIWYSNATSAGPLRRIYQWITWRDCLYLWIGMAPVTTQTRLPVLPIGRAPVTIRFLPLSMGLWRWYTISRCK